MTPTKHEAKFITAARQVVHKAVCETTILISMQARGLGEDVTHKKVARNHECITAKGITDFYPDRPFYIIITNYGKVDVKWSKLQIVGKVPSAPKI